MAKYSFTQNSFSGGLSDDDIKGPANSIAEGVGVDIHTKPGVFKASQALKDISGGIVKELCNAVVKCSDGTTYWFGSNGTIYTMQSDYSFGTIFRNTNYNSCHDAAEHDGYLFWTTKQSLGRVEAGDWTSPSEFYRFLESTGSHYMAKQDIFLFITNGRYLSSMEDNATFVKDGTSDGSLALIPSNEIYSAIDTFGIDLILGTEAREGRGNAKLYRWDTVSPTHNTIDEVPEYVINGFITVDNYTLAQAGNAGNLYYFNGSELEKFKKIPGDYENKTMRMNHNSVCQFNGLATIGISNFSGNPCNQGLYTIGQHDKNYPTSLMLEYVISKGTVNSLEIGATYSFGTALMVAWKSGGSCGIDIIDYSTKQNNAYIKTLAIGGNRRAQKTFQEYNVSYRTKPTGTDIGLSYLQNFGSTENSLTLVDQTSYNKLFSTQKFDAGSGQFKINLTTSGNSTPEIQEFYTLWDERPVI